MSQKSGFRGTSGRARRWARVAALLVATLVGTALAAPASADPPTLDEEVAAYRILVPSSLLVAQGSGVDIAGVSVAAAGAALANPVTVGTVEAAGGLSVLATGGVTLAAGAGVTIVGGVIGFAVGTTLVKATGLGDYESLCAGSVPGVDQLLAAVTLTDCTAWELAAETNWDQSWQPDAAAVGIESCDAGGKCATIYAVTDRQRPGSGVPSWLSDPSAAGYCVVETGVSSLTPSDAPQSHSPQGWFGNGFYANGPGPAPYTDCPAASTPGRVGFVSGVPNGNVPADAWAVTAGAVTAPVGLPGMLRADPERFIRCTLTYVTLAAPSSSLTATADTAPFHLSEGLVPRPQCPEVPGTATVLEFRIELVTDGSVAVLASGSTLPGYQLWRDTYPGCAGGECILDLLRDGDSCFVVGIACDGWVENTDPGVTYTCEYGGTPVDLDECNVYGVLFNVTARTNGHAYADPSTGVGLPEKTSPTAVDRIAASLLTGRMITTEHSASWPMPARPDPIRMARYAALQCVDAMETPGSGVSETDCRMKRIFLPGSDVHEAAVNDAAAIASSPAWFVLNFRTLAEKTAEGGSRDWYRPSICVPNTPSQHCDEYPFFTSVEGGTPSSGAAIPRVVNIDAGQNRREGFLWRRFHQICGTAESDDREVLVLPMPHTSDPTTMGFCEIGWIP